MAFLFPVVNLLGARVFVIKWKYKLLCRNKFETTSLPYCIRFKCQVKGMVPLMDLENLLVTKCKTQLLSQIKQSSNRSDSNNIWPTYSCQSLKLMCLWWWEKFMCLWTLCTDNEKNLCACNAFMHILWWEENWCASLDHIIPKP